MDNDSLAQQSGPVEVALAYGRAKSQQDIDTAIRFCSDDFALDCPALGTSSRGSDAVRAELERFFEAFPDYRFVCEGAASSDDGVVLWGRAQMTWTGRAARFIKLSERSVDIPATAVFTMAPSGLLASELFLFDGLSLAKQMGIPATLFSLLRG